MDGFFKINCYPIIFLLSLFSLQSPLLLSWFSRRHGFLYETRFLHIFSSLLINSPANSIFCLCGTIFNAMETSWVGGLGLALSTFFFKKGQLYPYTVGILGIRKRNHFGLLASLRPEPSNGASIYASQNELRCVGQHLKFFSSKWCN